MIRMLLTAVVASTLPLSVRAAEPDANGAAFFEKKIRPLFVEHCLDCHSGDEPQAELSVETLAGLIHGGTRGPAIVIGKPEESLLVRAIRHGELVKMPPKQKLPAAQIADVVRWIAQGAVWPNEKPPQVTQPAAGGEPAWTDEQKSFWSFQPPLRPSLPEVKNRDWVQTPIDAFILARLEEASFAPAPRADKRTLIRRATFDLTGLPPTPEEVEAFLADDSPGAFARVIDRLLASPHYGQRWGRHWLDVARYADSNGLDENLAYANAFRYRDYVIRAMNDDLPFDQFVSEQLAGDLLAAGWLGSTNGSPQEARPPGAALRRLHSDPSHPPGFSPSGSSREFDQITATGFLSLGAKMLAEDDPVKMQMDIIDEQIDTVGRAFMGLTLGCARCHDHKFDPISAHDYYALAGIFKSTKTMENYSVVARWQEVPLATDEAQRRRKEHKQKLHAAEERVERLEEVQNGLLLSEARRHVGDYLLAAIAQNRLKDLLADVSPRGDDPGASKQPGVLLVEAEDFARGNVLKDFSSYGTGIGVLVNKGQTPNFVEYDLELPAAGLYQVELRYAAADSRPCKLFINGELVKTDAAAKVTGSWQPDGQRWGVEGFFPLRAKHNVVRLEHPQFFPHIDKLLIAPAPDGVKNVSVEPFDADYPLLPQFVAQWAEYLANAKGGANGVFHDLETMGAPEARETAKRIGSRFRQIDEEWRKLRESDGDVERLPDEDDEALRRLLYDEEGPFELSDDVDEHYPDKAQQQLARLHDEVEKLEESLPKFPTTMAVVDENAHDVRIHIRGSHLTQGATVERRLPRVLLRGEQPGIGKDQSGRLQLARWLTAPDHPLTARVFVNRVWLWHFGEGLVRSPDNLGRLGERPTHPELLDWLAVEFIKSGWSIKSLHRLILLSSTWQQSVAGDAQAIERDPENRLLGRMNRRRLEAEAIRDSLLAVAGALEETMGGTQLPTKNREYVTSTANVNPQVYNSDRRSIYLPVVRSALYDVFQAFDFADPSVMNGRRQSTTVAPQALFMMNSQFVAEQSRRLAERLLNEEPTDENRRLHRAWMLAYSRPPSREEVASASDYLARFSQHYRSEFPERDDAELRSWQSLSRAIMSANEFLFVE